MTITPKDEEEFMAWATNSDFGFDPNDIKSENDAPPVEEDDDLPEWVVKGLRATPLADLLAGSERKALDTDPDPSPKPSARRLRRYWTRGPGAAKIGWGAPGDFNRCVAQLAKYVTDPKGLCNVYHQSALGAPPGKGHGKSMNIYDLIEDARIEVKRHFSEDEREDSADRGHALPDGSFPIENISDLRNAIHAYGRAKDKSRAKRHICKRARDLGAVSLLPDDWKNEKAAFTGDVKSLEAVEMMLEMKVRRVRTPAGVRRFKQPIGSIIIRDLPLNNIRIKEPKYDDWDLVEGRSGKLYDVGKDEDGKWRAYGTDDWDDMVAEGNSEDEVYEALDKAESGGKGKGRGKRSSSRDEEDKKPRAKKPYKPTRSYGPRERDEEDDKRPMYGPEKRTSSNPHGLSKSQLAKYRDAKDAIQDAREQSDDAKVLKIAEDALDEIRNDNSFPRSARDKLERDWAAIRGDSGKE